MPPRTQHSPPRSAAEPAAVPPAAGAAADFVDAIRIRLLDFFDRHARDLPWRRDRTAYRVWTSEIMLQQTRVDAVIPYYERWMRRFPTIDALADASQDDVLRAWEGLGYYSRARNLHRAARLVRERFSGELPDDYDSLRALPGVGDYTAGAIASIVYDRQEPAIDGNVRRVLTRILDRDLGGSTLRTAAAALVLAERPGDFNQALMELGATICTPRSPRCGDCPVSDLCLANAAGTQALRPAKKRKAKVPSFDVGVAVVCDGAGRVLLVRRPDHGLLAGMWELPGAVAEAGDDPADAALRAARRILRLDEVALETDERVATIEPVATIEHRFSHRVERYHAYVVAGTFRLRTTTRRGWYDPTAPSERALPRAQRKLLAVCGRCGV